MIELPAAHIRHSYSDRVEIDIPDSLRGIWEALRSHGRFKASQQLYVKLALPKRPRTTGEKSQNHHAWGHAVQIGAHTGDYKEDVIAEAKRRAVTHGYPTRQDSFGNIVPMSESTISTVEAGYLIDELHHIASDLDVKLKEI